MSDDSSNDETPVDAEVVEDDGTGLNCNVWGEVDFGRGPVGVRCTRVGLHLDHMAAVSIEPFG